MLAAIASDWWWPKAKRARETGQENGQTGNQKCTVSPSFLPSSSPCFVRKPTYALYQSVTSWVLVMQPPVSKMKGFSETPPRRQEPAGLSHAFPAHLPKSSDHQN